ncbi:MAG: hypothetical protein AAF442_07095 [Pseudomonadota bacterium]
MTRSILRGLRVSAACLSVVLILVLGLSGCSRQAAELLPSLAKTELAGLDIGQLNAQREAFYQVVPLDPATIPGFAHYTRLVASDGSAVHFLAQEGVPPIYLERARRILSFFLHQTEAQRRQALAASPPIVDKDLIARAMGQSQAVVIYTLSPKVGREVMQANPALPILTLLTSQTVIEGSPTYVNETRPDLTYGMLFGYMLITGVKPGLPNLWAQIRQSTWDAAQASRIIPRTDLEQDTLSYYARGLEIAFGYWREDVPYRRSLFDFYPNAPATREQLRRLNPELYEVLFKLVNRDFSSMIHVIDPRAERFTIGFNPLIGYTNKSQHIVHAELTGDLPSALTGNGADNQLIGNAGDNRIEGGGGDDTLIGGAGIDTAVYSGRRLGYNLVRLDGGVWLVSDRQPSRDGRDRVQGIERLQFSDQTLTLSEASLSP